ncbi:hypothetical protein [Campylobacter concisus]|uniref:Uncharacterized protein n=1 Tax=Campylobacter concisus TaxID=199 RepID=A0A1Y5N8N3_9BACT|nr:hypothetical protein [Campylobacter concisus]OUT17208.1 hypothetical protein B9N61_07635 [Campylobacter concisus]
MEQLQQEKKYMLKSARELGIVSCIVVIFKYLVFVSGLYKTLDRDFSLIFKACCDSISWLLLFFAISLICSVYNSSKLRIYFKIFTIFILIYVILTLLTFKIVMYLGERNFNYDDFIFTILNYFYSNEEIMYNHDLFKQLFIYRSYLLRVLFVTASLFLFISVAKLIKITKEKIFWAYALFGAFHIASYFIKIDHKIYDYIDIGAFFIALIAWWRLKTQASSDEIQVISENGILNVTTIKSSSQLAAKACLVGLVATFFYYIFFEYLLAHQERMSLRPIIFIKPLVYVVVLAVIYSAVKQIAHTLNEIRLHTNFLFFSILFVIFTIAKAATDYMYIYAYDYNFLNIFGTHNASIKSLVSSANTILYIGVFAHLLAIVFLFLFTTRLVSATKSRLFWINFILFVVSSVILLALLFPGKPDFIGLLTKNIDLFNIAEFFFLLIAWYSVKKDTREQDRS